MKEPMVCARCIMTSDYPGLTFSTQGICDHCVSEDKRAVVDWDERKGALEKRIESIQKEATQYHVIVPWSGGKDSTYVLYMMKKQYGLRVLAVNFENGFKSQIARNNLDSISRRLGIDLITLRPDWRLMCDLYRQYMKERGELCSVCNIVGYVMIFSFVLKESKALGYFPLVVGGWSGRHENVRSMFTFDYGEFRKVISRDSELFRRFENSAMVNREVCEILELLGDPRAGSAHIGEEKGSKFFQLPDFLEWDLARIQKTLWNELDWVSSGSPIVAHEDCNWHPTMKYLMLKKYKIDNDTIALSAMVRSGNMAREEALKVWKETDRAREPEGMRETLDLLGCSTEEINWDSDWYTGENIDPVASSALYVRAR